MMKPPLAIGLVILSCLIVGDAVALGYIHRNAASWPDLPGVVLLAISFSQVTLTAAWFSFCRWNVVLRLAVAAAAIAALAVVGAGATDGIHAVAPWIAIQSIVFGSQMLPLWLTKLYGFVIDAPYTKRAEADLPGWQFSVWGLLSGTTAVAIAITAARQMEMPMLDLSEAIAFFGCITAIGLVAFLVTMHVKTSAGAFGSALPVVILLCPFGGVLAGETGLPPEELPLRWALFGFAYGAAVAVAVLPIRLIGFRWRRVSRTGRTAGAAGSAGSNPFAPQGSREQPSDAGVTPPRRTTPPNAPVGPPAAAPETGTP